MNIEGLIRKYLNDKHMMQVATCVDDQPWSCTVYYVSDENLKLYWASLPTRRHSVEIAKNSQVAVSIPVKHSIGDRVVGIQVEGKASTIEDSDLIEPIAKMYAQKFNRSKQWVGDFSAGKTQHKLYCIVPDMFVLFDEENFAGDPRQEWYPGSVQ